MKDGVTDPGAHERYLDAVTIRYETAHHRRQYVAVQKRTQNTSAGRRVPIELAVLRHVYLFDLQY